MAENQNKYVSPSKLAVFLENLKQTFSPLKHQHTISDLKDYVVDEELSSESNNPVANKVIDAEFDEVSLAMNALEVATDEKIDEVSDAIVDLSETVSTNYDESIISLSIDGTTVTYMKGDGSVHSFETQDTNTTYSLGTDEITGLTKLYATIGSAEDGTMTQKAIKTELDKKVGVTIDDSKNTLIFTI